MENILSKLGELVEHCGEASKHLIKSEIYLNDGDLAGSQKYTMKAIDLLKTMTNDVFVEVLEELGIESDNVVSDIEPSTLCLAHALSNVCYNAGVVLNMYIENEEQRVKDIANTKLMHAINDAKSLFEEMYM